MTIVLDVAGDLKEGCFNAVGDREGWMTVH